MLPKRRSFGFRDLGLNEAVHPQVFSDGCLGHQAGTLLTSRKDRLSLTPGSSSFVTTLFFGIKQTADVENVGRSHYSIPLYIIASICFI